MNDELKAAVARFNACAAALGRARDDLSEAENALAALCHVKLGDEIEYIERVGYGVNQRTIKRRMLVKRVRPGVGFVSDGLVMPLRWTVGGTAIVASTGKVGSRYVTTHVEAAP
jgi:hypothetical protein